MLIVLFSGERTTRCHSYGQQFWLNKEWRLSLNQLSLYFLLCWISNTSFIFKKVVNSKRRGEKKKLLINSPSQLKWEAFPYFNRQILDIVHILSSRFFISFYLLLKKKRRFISPNFHQYKSSFESSTRFSYR